MSIPVCVCSSGITPLIPSPNIADVGEAGTRPEERRISSENLPAYRVHGGRGRDGLTLRQRGRISAGF